MADDDDFGNDSDSEEEGLVEEKPKKPKNDKAKAKTKSGKGSKEGKKKKKKKKKKSDDDDDDDDDDGGSGGGGKSGGFIDDAAVLSGSDDEEEEEEDDDINDYERDGFVVDEDDEEEEEEAPKKRRRGDDEDLQDSDEDSTLISDDSDDEALQRKLPKPTKKLKRMRDMDQLDDDDMDLINEAKGLPSSRERALAAEADRKRKMKLGQKEQDAVRGRDGAELSKELFTGVSSDEEEDEDEDDDEKRRRREEKRKKKKASLARPERYDEDGLDDFIEDDIGDDNDGGGGGRRSGGGYDDYDEGGYGGYGGEGGVSEAQMNEASEIFGSDYMDFMDTMGRDTTPDDDLDDDYDERKRQKKFRERGVGVDLGVGSDEEIEDDSEEEEDEDEDDDLFEEEMGDMEDKQRAEVLRLKREKKRLEREERRRAKREKVEARRKAQLRRAFEPVQLVENFCTERDDAIRMSDAPERYYDWLEAPLPSGMSRREVPAVGAEIDFDEEEEAMWILQQIPAIASESYSISAAGGAGENAMTDEQIETKERSILESIVHALRFMRRDKLEPEFIKRYRADTVSSPAVRENLYRIMDEDAEWERMVEARSKIESVLGRFHEEVQREERANGATQNGGSGNSAGTKEEEELARVTEERRQATQKLDDTVKDEERIKAELLELDKPKEKKNKADDDDDDDDDLFGDDDDEEEDEATIAAKEKQKESLKRHLETLGTLLATQSEHVARLDTAVHQAEAAVAAARKEASANNDGGDAVNEAQRTELLTKKMCRDKLWHYGDYSQYVSSMLEYRHVMDMKGYLNLVKEGNDAVRDKVLHGKGSSSGTAGASTKEKDKKKRSRRFDWDYYRTCVSEGLRPICYKFVLPPFRVGIKLEDTLTKKGGFSYNRKLPGDEGHGSDMMDEDLEDEFGEIGDPTQWTAPVLPGPTPQEFAQELLASGELVMMSTLREDQRGENPEMNDPLRGCRYVAAMELAHEPRIRRQLRAIYRSEAVISTRPTNKGMGVMDAFHEYYGLHLLRNKPVKEHFPMESSELERKRARLNAEEIKELDGELKLKETNSCIQYLNVLKAERSGDVTVQVHLPFLRGSEDNKPWYKQNPESMSRDHQDISGLMEALERVYLPADGDSDEWNEERRKILRMALINYLLPQFEAETRRDLKEASTQMGVEAAAQNLHTMAMEGPYRPSHLLGENRFIVPTGDLPIVGVCSSSDAKDGTFLAAVNGRGELSDHLAIPGGTSITSEKMREKVIVFLMQTRPAAVVVGSGGGIGAKLTARRLGEVISQATERWNNRLIQGQDEDDEDFEARMESFRAIHPNIDDDDDDVWKCNVDIVDDNVAQLFGRSVRGKKEFPDTAVNLKVAVATARWAKDPLCELAYTWSTASDAGVFGTEMLFLNIHPLQRLLPKPLLLRQYERVLCNVVAEVGVDLNGACTYDHMHGLLSFVPGLGPRKANNLKQSVVRIGGVVSSRKSLLAKRLLGPIVYNNSVGFLRICATDQLQDQMLHPLDDTRCHPDVYQRNKWAVKIAVDALELGDSAANDSEDYAITALRDVMQNSKEEVERLFNATKAEWEAIYGPTFNVGNWDPKEAVPTESWRDKVEELDLETFAEMIEQNGNGKWLTHLIMVKWEFRLPFEDPRKPMEPPSGEKLFRLLTGESDVTLCPGKEVTGKVIKNGDFGSQVKLEGDVPAFIPLRNLADDHVESAEDYVSVGTVVTAIITEVKMDHMCVDLSLKREDFKKKSSEWGRPRSLPPLDEHFDRQAAFSIDEEKDKEREARLQALQLTIGGTKIGGDSNDPNADGSQPARRSGKVTRRACAHPAFRNASHMDVDRELKDAGDAMVGEALIRPSNKSCDSLAIHWMVRPGCIKVVEVLEEDKDTDASIGNRLIIKKEIYESIDELLGRYIAPMNDRVEEVQHHRKFVDKQEDEVDAKLLEMKQAQPKGVFYFICWSDSYPGYVSLRFIMNRTPRNHTIGISPDGYVWGPKTYNNMDKLMNDFKKNPAGPGARMPQQRPANGSSSSVSMSSSRLPMDVSRSTQASSMPSRNRWGPAPPPPPPAFRPPPPPQPPRFQY